MRERDCYGFGRWILQGMAYEQFTRLEGKKPILWCAAIPTMRLPMRKNSRRIRKGFDIIFDLPGTMNNRGWSIRWHTWTISLHRFPPPCSHGKHLDYLITVRDNIVASVNQYQIHVPLWNLVDGRENQNYTRRTKALSGNWNFRFSKHSCLIQYAFAGSKTSTISPCFSKRFPAG